MGRQARSPSPFKAMAGRAVVGFTAAVVLMTACCALPVPSEGEVVLLEESAGWDRSDSWFHALEEEPTETSISRGTTALGEAEFPSYHEINHNMEENQPGPPGSNPPVVIPSNPRLPPEPRNPYGQMVQDMQDLKLSRRKLNENMRDYEKMQYHAVSAEEQDAVNNAITAVQGLMNARKPSQKLDAAADSANTQLMQATRDRRKREAKGAKLFASKGFIPVVDQHDETHLGTFTNMYLENLRMKRLENDAKGLREEAKGIRVSNKVRRDITPQSAVRRKEQNADNKWLAHDRDTSVNAKKSQAYHKEQKKMQVKHNLVQMLHNAAQSYKIAKFSNPNLKFEAMTPQQKRDEASRVAAQSMQMAQKENKLDNDVEDYHRKYSEGSSILPYKEWEKTWTMDRQANMQVNPKEEMAIRAMVAKMKAAHEKNDIM